MCFKIILIADVLQQKELNILDTDINTDYDELNELVNKALENRRDYLAQKLNLESYNEI